MASNPIQKKVRNSMLLGSLITLLVTGAIIALLLMQIKTMNEKQEEIKASYKNIYILTQDVKSGQIITEDMYQVSNIIADTVPSNAIEEDEVAEGEDPFKNYSLTDNEGNKVQTDNQGMFLAKNGEYIEIFKDEATGKYYTYGTSGEIINLDNVNTTNLRTDNYGMYVIQTMEGKTRLYKEETTEKYYILRIKYNTNNSNLPVREKEYVEIVGAPLLAKIDMNANTVLTTNMLALGKLVTADVRKQEYNTIVLPVDLVTGDYIDVRLQLPNGEDFIVVSKKIVDIPTIEGMDSVATIRIELSEIETLMMSCAIVEAYRINGSKLYAARYVEPGMQEEAIPTYSVNQETLALINSDANILETARQELWARYNVQIRNEYINSELQREENTMENVTNKMTESITKTQEERKEYLESLTVKSEDEDYED